MMRLWTVGSMALLFFAAPLSAEPERWENDIARFEEADREDPPERGGVLFLGSSSIRGWDTERWFPDTGAINRGFGGSTIPDSIHFADRIVLPYEPRAIVFYAGDNDIAQGHNAARVVYDYKRFVRKVHEELPETRIVFVAIKPSISRWAMAEEMERANGMIEGYSRTNDRLEYADVWGPMLNEGGEPREELFVEDGLHLSEEGYALWTEIVGPRIDG